MPVMVAPNVGLAIGNKKSTGPGGTPPAGGDPPGHFGYPSNGYLIAALSII